MNPTEWLLCVLKQLGNFPAVGMRVLEIGCGNGEMVHALRMRGIDAVGCDLEFKDGPRVAELVNAGLLKRIEMQPYRLPFDDESFDIIVSVSVLEHVMNLAETIKEMMRVTRSRGGGLHMFPARYRPIEPHTYVPFATLLRAQWWLRLWASLGIRNSFQAEMKSEEIAKRNYEYLHRATNYLPRKQIRREFEREFQSVKFCEHVFVECAQGTLSNRVGLGRAMAAFPPVELLYSAFRERIIWVQKAA